MKTIHAALGLIGLPNLGFEMWWKYRRHFEPKTAWNDAHQSFFIHIPKTAGTSIYDSLAMPKLPFTHAPARVLRDLYPVEFASYFSFAFVRNPWDRMVSTFEFLKNDTSWPEQRAWAAQHLGERSFQQFVLQLDRDYAYRAVILSYNFFFTQKYFVADRRGRIIVDRILRFEELTAEFAELSTRFGASQPLVHSRKTQGRSKYNEYYDAETSAIVGRLYAEDVNAFGYGEQDAAIPSDNRLADILP